MYTVHEWHSLNGRWEIKWLGWSWEFSTEIRNSNRHTRSSQTKQPPFLTMDQTCKQNCIGIYSHPLIYLWSTPLFIIQWHRWMVVTDSICSQSLNYLLWCSLKKIIIIKLTTTEEKTQYLVHPSGFSNTVWNFWKKQYSR